MLKIASRWLIIRTDEIAIKNKYFLWKDEVKLKLFQIIGLL